MGDSPSKVAVLSAEVLGVCDGLDGLVDGIVSNYLACNRTFNPSTMRCPPGNDDGVGCLSTAQLATIEALHSPYEFPFPLANGVTTYPPYGYGGEAQPGGYDQWVSGSAPITRAAASGPPLQWSFGSAVVRYFVLADAEADPFTYAPAEHEDRLREISALMDSTDPDLSAFANRGGKLIVKEHTADYAQSFLAGIAYYESVVATMTQPVVDEFMRLYVSPGLNHVGAGVSGDTGAPLPRYLDLLETLDRWVEQGEAPGDLVETAVEADAPFSVIASRPLCRFPSYPQYRGAGDESAASSYVCTVN